MSKSVVDMGALLLVCANNSSLPLRPSGSRLTVYEVEKNSTFTSGHKRRTRSSASPLLLYATKAPAPDQSAAIVSKRSCWASLKPSAV